MDYYLGSIKVTANGSDLFSYILSYQSIENKTVLNSVQKCSIHSGQSHCVPATEFKLSDVGLSGFGGAENWYNGWGTDTWDSEKHIRQVLDVNGDALPDLVGFHDNDVYVSLNQGNSFSPAVSWITGFGSNSWDKSRHIRLLADVNGDLLPDIVGFHDNSVYISLNSGNGFNTPFTGASGWGDLGCG